MTSSFFSLQELKQRTVGMATPLASIFGSGFLVIVSVLASAVGPWSLPAMAGICLLAYATGDIIRFNIAHAEPLLRDGGAGRMTQLFEKLADIALVPAYIISVTLYLNILSSYALGFADRAGVHNERMLTSCIIVFILYVGLTRGLEVLEGLERTALDITMLIIALLIAAFAFYDANALVAGDLRLPVMPDNSAWQILTVLGGTLIVVQGFETTRYLGAQYDAETRIRACRNSQIVASVVYLALIALATPLMHLLPDDASSDGLMVLAGAVAVWLPAPLVFAAIFSQFSAATADTIGASGNMIEFSRRKLGERSSYVIICGFALLLTWTSDTLQVLALASRAFALYYFLQAMVAVSIARSARRRAGFLALGAVLLFITLFAVPVG